MKTSDIYKDQPYEIRLKAPILRVMIIATMVAVIPLEISNIISKVYVTSALLLLLLGVLFLALIVLKKGSYSKASNILLFSVAIVASLSVFTSEMAGEQHFAINSIIGIFITILASMFGSSKKTNLIVTFAFLGVYIFDLVNRIITSQVTVATRSLLQQLTTPVAIYLIVILLLLNFRKILVLALDDANKRIEESQHKADILRKLSRDSAIQFEKNNDIKDNLDEAANTVKNIEIKVNDVKGEVDKLRTQFSKSENSLALITENVSKLDDISSSQSSNITETSAALEEMVASIKNVSSIIQNKMSSVNSLKSTADNGALVINKTKNSFQDVINHIDSIKSMTSIISKISSQTNLLAMNAAIEAAHAGASGKGFAVVADEVRKLAESSALNVKQISETLKELITSINDTDKNVQNSGNAFLSISKEVMDVNNAMNEIDTSVRELSIGSDEILVATSMMNELTAQVNDAVKEVQSNDENVVENISEIGIFVESLTSRMDEIAKGSNMIYSEIEKISHMSEDSKIATKEFTDKLKDL